MATEKKAEQEVTNSGVEYSTSNQEEGVLLYYKFVHIPECETIKSWLFDLSASLGLLGRIRVAPDGINVTAAGKAMDIDGLLLLEALLNFCDMQDELNVALLFVKVGGKMTALHEHIRVVGSNPLFEGSDFKLASIVSPINHEAAAECGFTSLSARMVKELVTLGLHPSVEPPSVSRAGKHVTAQEFHAILSDFAMASEIESLRKSALEAGGEILLGDGVNSKKSLDTISVPCGNGNESKDEALMTSPSQELCSSRRFKKIVVVDARNLYETRIGKFCPPQGVQVLDPMVRQYRDLPSWIDEHEDHLRNNQILMYCTGGVRCEMASAYIRSKGKEFEDVLQLSGGIQRYLDAFPDGGYFAGKNFVFDHRLAVPSSNMDVVGSCIICAAPFDDYSARCRCSLCRMLVLVCADCEVAGVQELGSPEYICELCSKGRNNSKPRRQIGSGGSQLSDRCVLSCGSSEALLSARKDEIHERKLKILCLHGFRQSASSLKGRLNALRKKLRQKVEFVFIDAPHEVPSINLNCQPETSISGATRDVQSNDTYISLHASSAVDASRTATRKVSKKFAWLINPVTMEDHSAIVIPKCPIDRSNSVTNCDGPEAQPTIGRHSMIDCPDFVTRCNDSEAQLRTAATVPLPFLSRCLPDHSRTAPDQFFGRVERPESGTAIANSRQYQTQIEGWSRSWDHLKTVFAELGPFDGVLGFSQGAAVAAALCNLRRSILNEHAEAVDFNFVILCSGFCSPAVQHHQSTSSSGPTKPIDCPSLHVFGGNPGLDRQIGVCESEKLASLFESDHRTIVRHNSGHIVPTQPEYTRQYLKFLSRFK